VQERRAPNPLLSESQDVEGLVRHVALADWMVLAVVLVYELVTPGRLLTLPVGIALAAFAAVSTALRLPQFTASHPTAALELESWAMIAFITVIAWFTGGADSPLASLYLLPVVLAALVLPGGRLLLALLAITVGYGAIAALGAGTPPLPAALAGRVLVAIGPLLVVAWLTAQLGSAVLSAKRQAASLTDCDALTGLATRRVFLDRLKHELSDAARREQPCAVLVVDLDGSRRINELYGNEAGNAALKLVAEALKRTLRETDLAARAGGDEFAVLLPGATVATAQVAVQRIRHAVNTTSLEAGARLLRCSVSIGSAAAPRDGRDAVALLAGAERRLDQDRDLRRTATGAVLQS
jgi:diguanylate cyclase (GGDEF)-like protein